MSARRIAVISAGLSNPSSTRMLADRLAAETAHRLTELGSEVSVDVIELRDLAPRRTRQRTECGDRRPEKPLRLSSFRPHRDLPEIRR